jgi:hypothetical protein
MTVEYGATTPSPKTEKWSAAVEFVDRASSASNNWAVSDNSVCERWIAMRTSSCGVSQFVHASR